MNNYPPQYNQQAYQQTWNSQSFVTRVSDVMKSVYLRMTGGLVVTALIAMFCGNSDGFRYFMADNSWFTWLLVIAEFGIVIGVSAGINKLSSATAALLFYVFAVVNGLMLSGIFVTFSGVSIAKTFFITAGTFAAMSVYGYSTNRDLTKIGSILFMALIGLIIVSLVNIFIASSGLDWIISIAGVLIFVGLTAWDTQQIKKMAQQMPAAGVGRLATLGALSLYLDFINLFLYLLRFFGSSND